MKSDQTIIRKYLMEQINNTTELIGIKDNNITILTRQAMINALLCSALKIVFSPYSLSITFSTYFFNLFL